MILLLLAIYLLFKLGSKVPHHIGRSLGYGLVPNQDFPFFREASDRSGSSSPIRENYNPTHSIEHFVCIVNTSSLYFCFSADEVSVMHVIPPECLHISCRIL